MVKLFRELLVADQIGLADFGGQSDAAERSGGVTRSKHKRECAANGFDVCALTNCEGDGQP